MTRQTSARIQDLLGLLHGLYPPDLAEDWDNVGLQVGDPSAPLSQVLVALDASEAAVEEARKRNCQALLTHHPLILRPLKNITPSDSTGRTALTAIRNGISILSAHTNLDSASDGLNDWLAARLALREVVPLAASVAELVKLAVYVPKEHAEAVAGALFDAGAGKVGGYDRCSFRVTGEGTFRPGEGCRPFIGEQGAEERVEEVRIETILPRRLSGRVIEKMRRVHPYEEVAYDLYPLHNRLPGAGLGRIGRLAEATTLAVFAEAVKAALGLPALRVVGDPQRRLAKVALCGGSGASLLAEADRQGADVLVTGDVKYHEARQAEERGIALLDAGHFGTEHLAVGGLVEALSRQAATRGMPITCIAMEGEHDPFMTV